MRSHTLRLGLAVTGLLCLLLPLSAARAAFPGGNGLIAYTCGTAPASVCAVDANAGGPSQVSLVANASEPAWSSDGAQIAYVAGNGSGLHVADVNGTTLSNDLTLGTVGAVSDPTWSPDSTQLAYVSGGDIWTIDSDTSGGATDISQSPGLETDPAWSANDEIAFASDALSTPGSYDIWVMNPDGSNQQRVTTSAADERHPNWSPDGFTILYASKPAAGASTLASVPESGGTPAAVAVAGSGPTEPAYSPDGAKLVYVDASGNLHTASAGGGAASDTVIESGGDGAPDWQRVDAASTGGSGPPKNEGLPMVFLPFGSTAPEVGRSVSATVGSWSGSFPITYKYQWKKCDVKTTSCYAIPDATSSFFTPRGDEFGWQLRVEITATNSDGSTSQNSLPTAAVTALPPHLKDTPPIFGENVENETLAVSSGNWSGSLPITFSYEWRRCDAFGTIPSCKAIPGATGTSYTLTAEDIDLTIRVFITGTNFAGSETDFTNHTFPTLPRPRFAPSATATPVVTGEARLGSTLVLVPGDWTGEPPITTAIRWERCDATGASCVRVASRRPTQYKLGTADIGSTIEVVVSASNEVGSTDVTSTPTDAVRSVPTAFLRGRRIVGTGRPDYIAGGGGNDVLVGLNGNDTILAGAGDDKLDGGAGNDILDGGTGVDTIVGGAGSDTILAADGTVDHVDCGPGNDRAVVDTFDVVKNCEVLDGGSIGLRPGSR